MKHSNTYTIVYATIVAVTCATLLTAASELTRERYLKNKKADKSGKILAVLGAAPGEDASVEELLRLFEEKVDEKKYGELAAYTSAGSDGSGGAVAFHFEGAGRNATIRGYLALDADLRTVRGITFYDHEETPGLGGEISKPSFKQQFVGKRIVAPDGSPGFRVVSPGTASGPDEVDAISGATVTSDKVQVMLNDVIERIVEETGENGG